MESKLTATDFLPTEEAKLSWLGIDDLKSMLDYAKWSQDQLTPKDSTNLHDYWHNIIEKTSHELANKITEIFPFES